MSGELLAANETVDLHLHSTASDGSQPPEGVVATALAAGVRAIALTDHDTVAGVPLARQAAAGTALDVIAGVELSAYQGDDEVHVLGLHLAEIDVMDGALSAFRDARVERAKEMVERLRALGVAIEFSEVYEAAKGGALGRPHVAKVLVENGWARDFRDAFDRYLRAGRPAYLEKRRLTMQDAIAMIHHAGGIAVLAHPGAAASTVRLRDLKALGLDGAEVLHPSHSADDRRRILESLRSLAMVPSGGSDSHGAVDGARVLGAMRVPYAWVEEQRAYLTRGRQASVA